MADIKLTEKTFKNRSFLLNLEQFWTHSYTLKYSEIWSYLASTMSDIYLAEKIFKNHSFLRKVEQFWTHFHELKDIDLI